MSEENKLAYPQKLDIDSFPKERKRRTKKKGFHFLRKTKRRYNEWKEYREWKKSQSKKSKPSFFENLVIFFLGPIADFLDDLRTERALKKTRNKGNRPSFFTRLIWMYQDNKAEAKQTKMLDKKVRKSLAFVLEEDKRVFSFKDEIYHIKDTWKRLPWNRTREIENMIVATFVIVLSFSFNYGILQLAKYTSALVYDIPAYWHEGRIIFNIPDPSKLWTYSSVVTVYISGPISLFISGIIFLWRHRKTRDKSSFQAILFLWLYLTAFVLFFGSFLAGIFTDRGFGYVMGWLYIPKYIEIPFGIFSVFMLWMLGFSAGKKFMSLTPGYAFYSSVLPQFFIKLLNIYIPVTLSIIILLIIGFNSRDFTIQLIYISLIAMLTPTLRFIPEKME